MSTKSTMSATPLPDRLLPYFDRDVLRRLLHGIEPTKAERLAAKQARKRRLSGSERRGIRQANMGESS